MKFKMNIDCNNAAFDDNNYELARILKEVAYKLECGHDEGFCRDVNGNTVGTFEITEE